MSTDPEHQTTSTTELRHALLARIWSFFAALSLVAAPLSLLRIRTTGWREVYALHLGLMVMFILGHLAREQMSHRMRLGLLMGAMTIMGIGGLWTFGMVGAGPWALVLGSLIAGITQSWRLSLALFVSTALIYLVIMAAFLTGAHTLAFDVEVYLSTPAPWVTTLVFAIVLPTLIASAVRSYQLELADHLREIKRQRDELAKLALFDELTGLPARRLAIDRLAMAVHRTGRQEGGAALLFLDLDAFKAVNDRYGHAAGDEVLRVVARRIQEVLRVDDTVARLGGDEFLVILDDVAGEESVERVVSRIVEAIKAPIEVTGGRHVFVGVSIGVALAEDPDESIDALLERADFAMYDAKRSARRSFVHAGPLLSSSRDHV